MAEITLSLTPTDRIVRVGGEQHRIWVGEDQRGTPVEVAVRYVSPQTHDEAKLLQFEEDLLLLPKANTALVIDMRFVI